MCLDFPGEYFRPIIAGIPITGQAVVIIAFPIKNNLRITSCAAGPDNPGEDQDDPATRGR